MEWEHAELRSFFKFIFEFNLLIRPATKEELFNLHNSQLHSVIEHIFGVLKWKFCILLLPTEYDMEIQARLPAALSAIHNFTRDHDLEINEDDGPNIDK